MSELVAALGKLKFLYAYGNVAAEVVGVGDEVLALDVVKQLDLGNAL